MLKNNKNNRLKNKRTLKLIECVLNGDKKGADAALKSIIANNINSKLRKAANTEDLI